MPETPSHASSEPTRPDDYAASLDSRAASGDDQAEGIRWETEGDLGERLRPQLTAGRGPVTICGAVFCP